MFEMAKSVFGKAPPAAEKQARHIVSEHLHRGLRDPETRQIVAAAAKDDAEKATIRREALAKEEEILARLQPLLESWRRADSSLRQLTQDGEGREREFGYISSRRRLQAFVRCTLTAMGIELFVFFLLGVSLDLSGNHWSVQLIHTDQGFWLLAVLLPLLTYMPLYVLLLHRESLREDFNVPQLESARTGAEERFNFAATNLAVVSIREAINERFASFSTEFRLLDGRGLRALADPEREVSTAASEELATLLASLSSGSIGLSGPRGVGKTTLIESFARGRSVPLERERIGLVVTAPVKYDAKEFVLHLFASLCERVLGEERINELQSRESVSLHDRRRAWLIGALGLSVLLLAGIATAMLVFDKTAPEGPKETAYVLLAIAALVAYGGVGLVFRSQIDWEGLGLGWMGRLTGNRNAPLGTPERRALKLLEEIRFQQSISSSVSGSVRLPLGLGAGAESSVTMARTPWSLPEAVDAFRRYAGSLTEENYLVIGIDELDKMGSDASAKEFLNNIKGVFGVDGCYYLVSVSDDAMASFERRGMPVRDVFDSSFDAVQRVGYLTLEESRAVLGSRVVGLPIPYQCLCHCLAGGLPRDLIRITRELVHQAEASRVDSLELLSRAVVEAELRAKRAGAIEVSREAGSAQNERLQKWLDEQGQKVDPASLKHSVALLGTDWSSVDGLSLSDLAFEMATFDYYAGTVLELFRDGMSLFDHLERDSHSDPHAIEVLETLTKARQQFSISPGLAWERVAEAREKMKLELWEDPRQTETIAF